MVTCQMQHCQYFLFCCTLLALSFTGCTNSVPSEPVIETVTIEMTGHQFKWHSRYTGDDGQLGTPDDVHASQVLHVPVKAEVEIVLKSRDYIYSLEIPQSGLKEIAVPELTYSLHFKAENLGTFTLPGAQMCGYTHPNLIGTLIVENQKDYRQWLTSQRSF